MKRRVGKSKENNDMSGNLARQIELSSQYTGVGLSETLPPFKILMKTFIYYISPVNTYI